MNAPHQKLRIIVGGLVGQFPLGGVAWDYFHYLLGLHELGHEVYYHEDTWVWPHDPSKGYATDEPTYTVDFIRGFFEKYAPALADKWSYVLLHDKHFGMSKEAFDEVARTADIYLNVSGACMLPEALSTKCKRVFLDTDPGYNQIVMATRPGWSENVDRWIDTVKNKHDTHLTYAENIWSDDCKVPRCGLDWKVTRCVVTLPHWDAIKRSPPPSDAPLTTVMSWSYFKGPVAIDGVEYDAKASEFERFRTLPSRTPIPIRMAVSGDKFDPEAIRRDGWTFIKALPVSLTAESYQQFIADSAGEWSIAKNVYVATNSGWFSCRTACYLAAGRPAVVQDTSWSRYVESGAGLFAFRTMDQCVDALKQIAAEPQKHRAAAYEIAREYLAPDRVLTPMLEAIYSSSPGTPGGNRGEGLLPYSRKLRP
jgi:hypothetical protein